MLSVCPSCSAENRDVARYCDQCGAPISEDATAESVAAARAAKAAATSPAGGAKEKRGLNLGAIAFVVLVLAGMYLLLRPQPEPAGGAAAGMPGGMPGGPEAGKVMGEVLEKVGKLKQELIDDPLNTKAASPSPLDQIYGMYSQVGKLDKAREYVQIALDGIKQKLDKKEIDVDKAIGATSDVAQSAVMAGDMEGALLALTSFHNLKPDDLRVLPFLGNICFDLGRTEDAMKWYDTFLEEADPEKFSEYWNVKVDRATMYMSKGDDTKDASWYAKAKEELLACTKAQPKMFNAWFNLGQALLHEPDKQVARPAFVTALSLAGDDELLKYKANKELALLDGKEAPEMPNPHGEGMSLEEMGLGPAKPGVANPHGEGFGAGHGEAGGGGM